MTDSDTALANLERAADEVFVAALATMHGTEFASFVTSREQEEALAKARAKVDAAQEIVNMVARFKAAYRTFR
jgi:hypothetical protein